MLVCWYLYQHRPKYQMFFHLVFFIFFFISVSASCHFVTSAQLSFDQYHTLLMCGLQDVPAMLIVHTYRAAVPSFLFFFHKSMRFSRSVSVKSILYQDIRSNISRVRVDTSPRMCSSSARKFNTTALTFNIHHCANARLLFLRENSHHPPRRQIYATDQVYT